MATTQLTGQTRRSSPFEDLGQLLDQAQCYLSTADKRIGIDPQLESAWQQFHELYTNKIRKFAFSCGVTEQEIGDCIQEVWAELLVRLPSFRLDPERGRFDTWLFHIVRGKTADQLRARKRRLTQENVDNLRTLTDDHPSPASMLEDAEIFSIASAELRQRMSAFNYQILHMRLVENRTTADVAKSLGLTQEQVWYRYHRARREAEQIGAHRANGNCKSSAHVHPLLDGIENSKETAQGKTDGSVSRLANWNFISSQGGTCVDYVFQKLELGRRELTPEWKVEWNCEEAEPRPELFIRKLALVAYAEICGCEDFVNENWQRIARASLAAGVAAGIATIIATPSAALAVFQTEFHRLMQVRPAGGEQRVQVVLSSRQEANGPWVKCKSEQNPL